MAALEGDNGWPRVYRTCKTSVIRFFATESDGLEILPEHYFHQFSTVIVMTVSTKSIPIFFPQRMSLNTLPYICFFSRLVVVMYLICMGCNGNNCGSD